jgi:ElaB/YqjD/DUF883 family membrane-anchored ribosome-binding protein
MTRVTRRAASIVTPILAVVALAACGGGTGTQDKNAYARQVNAAQTKFALTVSTAASEESKGDQGTARLQLTLRRFRTAVDGVVRDLRHIDAPSEVSKEHEQLVSVMSGYGDEIGRTIEEMRNPTPRVAQRAKQRLDSAQRTVTAQVNAAIAAINVKLRGQ